MTPPPPALWPSTQEARGLVASLLQRWDLGELHVLPHSPRSGRAFNPKEVLQAPGLGGPLLVRWTDGWAIARWPSALGFLKWVPLSFLGLRLLSWAPPPQAPPTLSCCRGAGHPPGLVPPVPRCSLALRVLIHCPGPLYLPFLLCGSRFFWNNLLSSVLCPWFISPGSSQHCTYWPHGPRQVTEPLLSLSFSRIKWRW